MAVLEMTCDTTTTNLAVRGPVDRAGVDALRSAIAGADPERPMELDLSEATHFSRLGIAVLVAARRTLGEQLHVTCSGEVMQALEDAGLSQLLGLA
jgi:anti-anti-sigma regulatory factor